MAKQSGIYTITNQIDGKIYVGHTINLYKRKYDHFKLLNKKQHPNILLQNSYNKYGKDCFIYEILEQCDEKFLVSQEHYWATILNTHNKDFGYNLRPTNPFDLYAKGYRFKLSKDVIEWRKANYKLDSNRQRVNKENAKKAAKSRIGSKHSEKSKKRMTITKIGNDRIIEIFSKNGDLFNTCDFLPEAVTLTGVKLSNIKNNLYGITKSAGGFIFKHKILDSE